MKKKQYVYAVWKAAMAQIANVVLHVTVNLKHKRKI